MKKLLTLFFGLLVAMAAAYALPKEHKVPIQKIFNIEIPVVQAESVTIDNIQLDVDDGVITATNSINKTTLTEGIIYQVADEGIPQRGYRQADNYELKQTRKGLLDKNWCHPTKLTVHKRSYSDTSFLDSMRLIE